jgi:RNA polymerase sigma-70 factor (ECF subfamily)
MTVLQTLKDSELVKLAQDGDSEAFGELVLRYENKIYRLARRMTETQEDAEDILQEAFIRAFKCITGFRSESRFPTWLYRITVNLALMSKRGRQPIVESLDEPIATAEGEIQKEIRDTGFDPLAALIAQESQEILDRAISELPPTNRAVFVLRHIEGLSTEETKKALNISTPAVKSRLHRTRLALQERLARMAREEALAACAV